MCDPCVPCNNVICRNCMQYWRNNGHRPGHGPSNEEVVARKKKESEAQENSQSKKKQWTPSNQINRKSKQAKAQGTIRKSRRSTDKASYTVDEHGCSHDNRDTWQECIDVMHFYDKKSRSDREQKARKKGNHVKELSQRCRICNGPALPSSVSEGEEYTHVCSMRSIRMFAVWALDILLLMWVCALVE